MGVDLSGKLTDGIIGYRAQPNPPAVDLSRLGFYDPAEFWEPIKRPAGDAYILEANRFYILVSKERIRVPPDFAAEMVVYDAGAGEMLYSAVYNLVGLPAADDHTRDLHGRPVSRASWPSLWAR